MYFLLEIARSLHRGVEGWQFLSFGNWIPATYLLATFARPVGAAWRYSLIWTVLLYGRVAWGGLGRRERSAILAYVTTVLLGQLTVASWIIPRGHGYEGSPCVGWLVCL
ncbi:hypothetical protein TJA_03800 [Thermus sp. LT1-2-5]